MPLLPDETELERAVGEAILLAFSGGDLTPTVAAGSVYFGPTDEPTRPRPAVRCFWGAQVQLGRDVTHPVQQRQRWRVVIDAVNASDYTIEVLDVPYLYSPLPGDGLDEIRAGLLAEIAADPDPDATAEAGADPAALFVEAVAEGVHLDLQVSEQMSREVVRDRAVWQTATSAERTLSIQVATELDPAAPSAKQHALAYANLLRARLVHPDLQARLRQARAAIRRIVAGPIAGLDFLNGTVTETRATLEVVLSITVGAQHAAPVMESAGTTTTIAMEHPT